MGRIIRLRSGNTGVVRELPLPCLRVGLHGCRAQERCRNHVFLRRFAVSVYQERGESRERRGRQDAVCVTHSPELWRAIQQALRRDRWTVLADLYIAVERAIDLD